LSHEELKQALIEQGKSMGLKRGNLNVLSIDDGRKQKLTCLCPKCERIMDRRGLARHLYWHDKPSPRVDEAIRLYFEEDNTLTEVCLKLKTTKDWLERNFEDKGLKLRTPSEVLHLQYRKGRKPATPSGSKAPHW